MNRKRHDQILLLDISKAMRRRVVVHQDVVIQPPRTQTTTMAPRTTPNVKSLFHDSNSDQEAKSMIDLFIEAVPTSQSLKGLSETLNPNLEEPLPGLLVLSDVEDVTLTLTPLPGMLSQTDYEDEFENPKKRIRGNNKVKKCEDRISKKTKPPSTKSKPSTRREGDEPSVFIKRCGKNTAIRAWPEATRPSEGSNAGPAPPCSTRPPGASGRRCPPGS
ncbi:uncharacterized protein [Leptinotarsa decemlineata]|uniref:uncharacterized protein n=1 Tax=Leptinotarsa decemlineata TaxID=7539 RepID=UPI003D3052A3